MCSGEADADAVEVGGGGPGGGEQGGDGVGGEPVVAGAEDDACGVWGSPGVGDVGWGVPGGCAGWWVEGEVGSGGEWGGADACGGVG